MSDHLPAEWVEIITTWAANERGVQRVYLYGSRVKGTATPTSDLDVAVVARSVDDETATIIGFFGQKRWREAVNGLLPVEVHLQSYEPEHDTKAVGKGVTEHGICIFDRDAA